MTTVPGENPGGSQPGCGSIHEGFLEEVCKVGGRNQETTCAREVDSGERGGTRAPGGGMGVREESLTPRGHGHTGPRGTAPAPHL